MGKLELRMGLGLFLGFLLICHVLPLPLSVSAEEETKSTSTTCPENFRCGNLTNQLGFPFSNSTHPSNCGLFMLDCEAESVPKVAFASPLGPWFSVVNVSAHVITLRDDDFEKLQGTGICDIFYYDDKHLPKPSPSFSYSILPNITLYGCTRDPLKQQWLTHDVFPGYQHYDECSSVIIYYQNQGYPAAPGKLDSDGNIQAVCKNVTLPIMVPGDDYSSKPDLFHLLTRVFDLEWHVSEDCYTCDNEGHQCRIEWSQHGHPVCAKKGILILFY